MQVAVALLWHPMVLLLLIEDIGRALNADRPRPEQERDQPEEKSEDFKGMDGCGAEEASSGIVPVEVSYHVMRLRRRARLAEWSGSWRPFERGDIDRLLQANLLTAGDGDMAWGSALTIRFMGAARG